MSHSHLPVSWPISASPLSPLLVILVHANASALACLQRELVLILN